MSVHREELLIQPRRGRKGFLEKRSFKLRSEEQVEGNHISQRRNSISKAERLKWNMVDVENYIVHQTNPSKETIPCT